MPNTTPPADGGIPLESARSRFRLTVALTTLLLVVCFACGAWWLARQISERERTQWKGPALERLTKLSIANEEVRQELDALKATSTSTNSTELGWAHDHVLLMTNDEHIIYEYRHGRNDYFPPHLFLGHCSNGRWLYSSYHFCNSMMMVRYDDPPGSIAEFSKRYSAREFDGKWTSA